MPLRQRPAQARVPLATPQAPPPPSQGPGGPASTSSPGAGTIRSPGCYDPKGRTEPTKAQTPPSLQGLPITNRRT